MERTVNVCTDGKDSVDDVPELSLASVFESFPVDLPQAIGSRGYLIPASEISSDDRGALN